MCYREERVGTASSRASLPGKTEPAQAAGNKAVNAWWVVVCLIVLAFYSWTVTSSSDPSDWEWGPKTGELPAHPGPENYYHLLTMGFLSGHLSLPIAPKPELLALQNPFGPEGAGLRLQDASLYHGKYYLYYGPTPAVTLFLPWRLISGRGMPQSLAVLLYASAGWGFSCLLLFQLLRSAGVEISTLVKSAVALGLGLGNLTPVLLRRPGTMYEVAITAGFCFFMAAMSLLARRVAGEDRRPWVLVAAGFCAGLSAGCRPHYGVVAALVLALYCGYVIRSCRFRGRALVSELAYFAAPVALCGLALAWYNYARFSSPFEFGTNYQLTGSTITHITFHTRHVIPVLYFYLFSKPLWMDQFPFVQLMRQAPAPFGHPEWMPWLNLEEEFAGILTIAPLCVAGILLPLALVWRKVAGAGTKLIVLTVWGAALTMLLCISLSGSIGMRYQTDYAPELLVAALFVCLWAADRNSASRGRWVMGITLAACLWGTLCTTALSINSYNHSLRTKNPQTFRRLVAFFGGDPAGIRYPVRKLGFAGSIVFSPRPSSMREAILSSGAPHAGDVVFVEYLGRDRLRFGVQHWDWPEVAGPEVSYIPGTTHVFSVEYVRADYGRLTVRMDGQEVLRREGEIYFTAPGEVAVGQDKTGLTPAVAPFSGQLGVGEGAWLGFGV